MSRRLFPRLLAAVLVVSVGVSLSAQLVTYTWAARLEDEDWFSAQNWRGGVLPAHDLVNTRIVFGPGSAGHIDFDEMHVYQLSFEGLNRWLELHGGYDTTHLGAGGIVYNPTGPIQTYLMDRVQLHANQTWDIKGGTFVVRGTITDEFFNDESWVSGVHSITKTGAGTLLLDTEADGFWTGNIILNAGTLAITPYVSYYGGLGTGELVFNGGTLATADLYDEGDDIYIENDIRVNGLLRTHGKGEIVLGYSGDGESNILLTTDTTIESKGKPLFLSGRVTETIDNSFKVTVNSEGAVIVDGIADWSGGTHVAKGVLIFAPWGENSIASGPIRVDAPGYVGVTRNSEVDDLIAQLDVANSSGAIGFDSDSRFDPTTFTTPINLSATNAQLRLGSATHAVLGYLRDVENQVISSATITPFGNTYRFGSGGGTLVVETPLTDNGATPRNVVVDSPRELPLLVKLTNTGNNYSGGTSVTHSGLIFGSNSAPGGTGNITVNEGGYVGFEYWGVEQSNQDFINNSLAKLNAASTGMVGFDNLEGTIGESIDLSGFTNPIWLGTASGLPGEGWRTPGLILSGTITPQGNTYRFAGYKGGMIEVLSTLSGARTVVIGDPNSLGTMGDFYNEQYSTVRLSGENTHTGGTKLYMGELQLTSGAPLGTGTLSVEPHSFAFFPNTDEDVRPQITALGSVTIPNAVQLNADVTLMGGESSFTFDGTLSGAGEIYTDGLIAVVLNGNNSGFSGGFYFSGSTYVTAGTNTALGTGPLGFGYSGNTEIRFGPAATAPVIGGFFAQGDSDYAEVVTEADGAVITVNQPTAGTYYGEFTSESAANTMRLVKSGPGDLTLAYGEIGYRYIVDSWSPTAGTVEASLPGSPNVILQVNQGNLILDDYYISNRASTIWVNGGTLTLTNYTYVENPIAFTNGRLAGSGYVETVTIGTGATLSPGVGANSIGALEFGDLTLASGGLLEWNFRSANPEAGDHDLITISTPSTLHVTATADNPETPADERFTLKLISLAANGAPGVTTGFSGERSYTWTIFDATYSSIDGFDPNKFIIDASQFFTDLPVASLTLSQNGKLLQLTFQPVPEPSTYALMALGLAVVFVAGRRKFSRRRS